MSAFAASMRPSRNDSPRTGAMARYWNTIAKVDRGKVVAQVLGQQHLPGEGGGQAKDHELGDAVTQRATGAVLWAWWSCPTSSARTPTPGGSGNALAGVTMPSTQLEGFCSARRGSVVVLARGAQSDSQGGLMLHPCLAVLTESTS